MTTLYIVIGIICLPFVVALFVKNDYLITRSTTIRAPKAKVFEYVKQLKNQDYYNKWVMKDPGMEKTFNGTDGTIGFRYAWDSKKDAGKGEQEITNITDGARVDSEIRFEKPLKSTGNVFMTTESVSGTDTKVTWGMSGRYSYPVNIMNLFLGGMLGKDIDENLSNLKTILEK